ncbi:MAG: transporter substrate-binding domain-containing protein, partial [Myxococcota bacterium]
PAFVHLAKNAACVGKDVEARSCRIAVRSRTTSQTTAARLADQYEGVTYDPVELQNVYQVMWDRLRTREYDMLLVDEPYARDMLRSAARLRTRLRVTPVTEDIIDDPPLEKIGMAVKPDDDALREALNRGLDKHREAIVDYWQAMDRNTLAGDRP